jgi:hypothetical protein
MWVAIHKSMEAMLGISLYSYLCLKQAKTLCLSYSLLCFLFNKIRKQEGGTGSAQKQEAKGAGRGGGLLQTIYTHVRTCKNDKIKEKERKKVTIY